MGDFGTNDINATFLRHINGESTDYIPAMISESEKQLGIIDINLARNYGKCKFCHLETSEETPYHILMECPYTWRGRGETLGSYEPGKNELHCWEPDTLAKFFSKYNLEDLG